MDFKLTERFDDQIMIGENILYLNLSYDRVMRLFELFKDDRFSEGQKLDIALEMFAMNPEILKFLEIEEKNAALETIVYDFIGLKKQDDDEEEQQENDAPNKKLYDLDKDAAYIYASFLYDYNLDLFELQGTLHWNKFNALLQNLSDKSKFKEVVSIRAAEVPKPTKHNKEERDRLIKLKRLYSLEDEETLEDLETKLDTYFSMIANTRKKGGESYGGSGPN
ncbi:hypothetical protein DIC78_15885 [Bacillus halotolerans]|uniref:Gp15 family bacteriophage protein n=1 Tax=Bacillus halotolerans TaxID=260554 RepID=UPI000FD6BBCE|nr:Gp15 family bacteriophage protein [Bacillus halotolerans]AZV50366.1 hypothetical protein DIC78_15885 [Bacillus halotolerans]